MKKRSSRSGFKKSLSITTCPPWAIVGKVNVLFSVNNAPIHFISWMQMANRSGCGFYFLVHLPAKVTLNYTKKNR